MELVKSLEVRRGRESPEERGDQAKTTPMENKDGSSTLSWWISVIWDIVRRVVVALQTRVGGV